MQKQGGKGGQGGGRHGGAMMGMRELNLTAEQKQQMKSINQDFKTRMDQLNSDNSGKDLKAQKAALQQEKKDKISAILTPEQKIQFAQMAEKAKENNQHNGDDRMDKNELDRLMQMKTDLALTDDQVAKMKTSGETYSQDQLSALRKERANNMKSFLTADQIAKMKQMRGEGNFKQKIKNKDGNEKVKTKSS